MHERDFDEFAEILDDTSTLISRGRYVPDEKSTAMWFEALAPHPLAVVQAAFRAHVCDPERGQFVPVPADILRRIVGSAADDGRPAGDEAWATALRGANEAETIVWTAETAQAFDAARPVLQQGDEVGARKSFLAVYARLVDEARRAQRSAEWSVSQGHDAARRERAIAEAAARGLLAADVHLALPAPRGVPALLSGPSAAAATMPQEARAGLLALRAWITERPVDRASVDAAARAETQRLQAEAAARVAGVDIDVPAPAGARGLLASLQARITGRITGRMGAQ